MNLVVFCLAGIDVSHPNKTSHQLSKTFFQIILSWMRFLRHVFETYKENNIINLIAIMFAYSVNFLIKSPINRKSLALTLVSTFIYFSEFLSVVKNFKCRLSIQMSYDLIKMQSLNKN